ncbi:MAG TPA: peptidoglycan-binding protein [Oscillospiraceae bacterium]|nr:peptidoglycan-binding protein [Oscillospiraceae bacterium]
MNPDLIDRGRLQVTVLNENIALPLSDAKVRITNGIDGNVIEELTTNSSGQTPVIELPAPPLEYSMEPSENKPYSVYNVTATSKDFQTLHIGGIQILSGSGALQRAALKPAIPDSFNVQNLLIAPHTLWGNFPPKIPEPEVKPLPQMTGLVVLPQPVVPEFIVVHLGAPDDTSAKNVQVKYRDYIKTVASSEIYSTWPVETIQANVHAIISFTLNRVYTEWYRGKGFDFTVTNTTALDQAFTYGRNIFEDISVVVDDIFNTYITKENIVQPLLTQYCDGKRVQCTGLSQWGSKDLGESGVDALNILKSFYGADIFLESAEKVEGIPVSFEGTDLKLGSTGSSVETIQNQLNRISVNYPAIQKVKVNSEFDAATEAAVKEFQKIFHLPQTGIVDFATWYAISNIFVSVTKMAELR